MSKAKTLAVSVSDAGALVNSVPTSSVGSVLTLKEATANGVNVLELKAPAALAADLAFTLPSADGSNGQALVTNGSGVLSWASPSASAGGSNTQLQYNNLGTLAGASGLVTDGSNLTINAQGDLRFGDSDSSNWVAFQAPATVSSNVTWTLPSVDGSNGQVLQTNGSGTLSWGSASGISTGKAIAMAIVFG